MAGGIGQWGSSPPAWQAAYPSCDILNGDINGDGSLTMTGDLTPFVALISAGQGAHGLRAEFAWDGENRLVRVGPADGAMEIGAQRIEFVYDYLGRRVELRVSAVPDVQPLRWDLIKRRRFVWSGWLLLVEVDAGVDTPAVNNPLRRYTWGLDLGGTAVSAVAAGYGAPALQGAGGVGGLLAMQDANGTPWNPDNDLNYVYLYDANGNVGQLADWAHDPNDPAGAIVAKYEYGPYGENLLTVYDPNESGPYANQNPFRFSTKYFDFETGLSYFGFRYYNASMGRWINRDPIGELGGANVYAYVGNDPIGRIDPLGLMAALGCGHNGHVCPPPDANDDDGRCPRKGHRGADGNAWGPSDGERPEFRHYIIDWLRLSQMLQQLERRDFLFGLQDSLMRVENCGAGCQWLLRVIQELIDRIEFRDFGNRTGRWYEGLAHTGVILGPLGDRYFRIEFGPDRTYGLIGSALTTIAFSWNIGVPGKVDITEDIRPDRDPDVQSREQIDATLLQALEDDPYFWYQVVGRNCDDFSRYMLTAGLDPQKPLD